MRDVSTIRYSRRRYLLVSIAGLPALAIADLYDDYINSVSKAPFVAFLGRKGSSSTVGHSFIGLGVQIDSGLRVYERLFGLYPKNGTLAAIKSIISKTSGKLDYSWSDVTWDDQLIVQIDQNVRKQVVSMFDQWSVDAPKYSLVENGGNNCNGLTAAVAAACGLKVPSAAGTTRPWKFIEELKKLNPQN